MKKLLILNLLFLLIAGCVLNAQVRKIVLLEEATNSSCPDCAKSNVKLQEFFKSHFGGVISVRYHADWPGANDPMYVLNQSENSHRIRNYYGIYFVADYFMDGIDYGEPLDSLIMIDQMQRHLAEDAPVKIKIAANITADSVRATLNLIGVSPVKRTSLKLRIAVIERMVNYPGPPGSNGETKFPDVMRKMLPDTNGFAVSSINPGEQRTYYVTCRVNPQWKWQDLAVVGWLQSDENREIVLGHTTNHEVIQSNSSVPTYIIQCDEPLAEFVSAKAKSSKTLKIVNDNDVVLHLRLNVADAQVPAGWSYNLTHDNVNFDSVNVTITPGDSVVFGLDVRTGFDPGIMRLAVFARNLDDPYNYGYTAHYLGVTKTRESNVLFIDDDGGGSSETFYLPVFDSMRVRYIRIERHVASALKDQILAERFKALFWSLSEKSVRFSWVDIDFLETYLGNGGNLLVAVSDPEFFRTLTWFFVIWNYPFMDMCHNYLDAEFALGGWSLCRYNSFTGIIGTLGEGITTNLNGNSQVPIGSFSGASDTIFQYGGSSDCGGLSYDAGKYKAVFLGVGVEQFTSEPMRKLVIQNVVNWFGIPVGISSGEVDVPAQYNLEQNYPNPFNPKTRIKYTVPRKTSVTIKLFDVVGREVATLVDEVRETGSHEVDVNATGLASGIYFCRMVAPTFVSVKKMCIIK